MTDYSVQNDEDTAPALQIIRRSNEWRDKTSGVFQKQSVTAPTLTSSSRVFHSREAATGKARSPI